MEAVAGILLKKYFSALFKNFDARNDLHIRLLKGQATVTGLELNQEVVRELLGLECLDVKRLHVSNCTVSISPFHIKSSPIRIAVEEVDIVIAETVEDIVLTDTLSKLLGQGRHGGDLAATDNASDYGWRDKILDGIHLSIQHLNLVLKLKGAQKSEYVEEHSPPLLVLGLRNLRIQQTNSHWKVVDLHHARKVNADKEDIYVYRRLNLTMTASLIPCHSTEDLSFLLLQGARLADVEEYAYQHHLGQAEEVFKGARIISDLPVALHILLHKKRKRNQVIGWQTDIILDNVQFHWASNNMMILFDFLEAFANFSQRVYDSMQNNENGMVSVEKTENEDGQLTFSSEKVNELPPMDMDDWDIEPQGIGISLHIKRLIKVRSLTKGGKWHRYKHGAIALQKKDSANERRIEHLTCEYNATTTESKGQKLNNVTSNPRSSVKRKDYGHYPRRTSINSSLTIAQGHRAHEGQSGLHVQSLLHASSSLAKKRSRLPVFAMDLGLNVAPNPVITIRLFVQHLSCTLMEKQKETIDKPISKKDSPEINICLYRLQLDLHRFTNDLNSHINSNNLTESFPKATDSGLIPIEVIPTTEYLFQFLLDDVSAHSIGFDQLDKDQGTNSFQTTEEGLCVQNSTTCLSQKDHQATMSRNGVRLLIERCPIKQLMPFSYTHVEQNIYGSATHFLSPHNLLNFSYRQRYPCPLPPVHGRELHLRVQPLFVSGYDTELLWLIQCLRSFIVRDKRHENDGIIYSFDMGTGLQSEKGSMSSDQKNDQLNTGSKHKAFPALEQIDAGNQTHRDEAKKTGETEDGLYQTFHGSVDMYGPVVSLIFTTDPRSQPGTHMPCLCVRLNRIVIVSDSGLCEPLLNEKELLCQERKISFPHKLDDYYSKPLILGKAMQVSKIDGSVLPFLITWSCYHMERILSMPISIDANTVPRSLNENVCSPIPNNNVGGLLDMEFGFQSNNKKVEFSVCTCHFRCIPVLNVKDPLHFMMSWDPTAVPQVQCAVRVNEIFVQIPQESLGRVYGLLAQAAAIRRPSAGYWRLPSFHLSSLLALVPSPIPTSQRWNTVVNILRQKETWLALVPTYSMGYRIGTIHFRLLAPDNCLVANVNFADVQSIWEHQMHFEPQSRRIVVCHSVRDMQMQWSPLQKENRTDIDSSMENDMVFSEANMKVKTLVDILDCVRRLATLQSDSSEGISSNVDWSFFSIRYEYRSDETQKALENTSEEIVSTGESHLGNTRPDEFSIDTSSEKLATDMKSESIEQKEQNDSRQTKLIPSSDLSNDKSPSWIRWMNTIYKYASRHRVMSSNVVRARLGSLEFDLDMDMVLQIAQFFIQEAVIPVQFMETIMANALKEETTQKPEGPKTTSLVPISETEPPVVSPANISQKIATERLLLLVSIAKQRLDECQDLRTCPIPFQIISVERNRDKPIKFTRRKPKRKHLRMKNRITKSHRLHSIPAAVNDIHPFLDATEGFLPSTLSIRESLLVDPMIHNGIERRPFSSDKLWSGYDRISITESDNVLCDEIGSISDPQVHQIADGSPVSYFPPNGSSISPKDAHEGRVRFVPASSLLRPMVHSDRKYCILHDDDEMLQRLNALGEVLQKIDTVAKNICL